MQYSYQNKEEVLNTPLAKGFRLAQTNGRELVELRLHPQGEVPPHVLTVHITFYVIAGQGALMVDNEKVTAGKGDVFSVAANLQRSWKNTGSKDLVLLAIKNM